MICVSEWDRLYVSTAAVLSISVEPAAIQLGRQHICIIGDVDTAALLPIQG